MVIALLKQNDHLYEISYICQWLIVEKFCGWVQVHYADCSFSILHS